MLPPGVCGAALRRASPPNVVASDTTFAPATNSDKGTREKLETKIIAGARGIAEGWRNAGYSDGSESSGWSRRRRRLFRACRDTPRSPAATP